jgi:hypothetical protein
LSPLVHFGSAMHDIHTLIPGAETDSGNLDVFALRDRLHALFSRYGEVRRLDLVRADQGRARRVMCFLRMASEPQEQALVSALGMGRFGGDLVLVLALDGADAAQPWLSSSPQRSPVALH